MWMIIGCKNGNILEFSFIFLIEVLEDINIFFHIGLRLFKEEKDVGSPTKVSISLQKRHDHGFLGELKKILHSSA